MSDENQEQPVKRGRGRPPGAKNIINRDIRLAIENAFEKLGGEDYLVRVAQTKPEVFCALLGKVLPTQLTGADGGPITIIWDRG